MSATTGFTDVDRSGRSDDLVDYLALLAQRLAGFRRETYALWGIKPGDRVLDVGCGAGEVCVEVARRVAPGGRVAGVDLSQAMVDAARRTATESGEDIDLREASVYALPFADGTFDAVRAERVFQHLEDPAGGLREMLRVTRPGGRLLLIDPDHGQAGLAVDAPQHRRVFEAARRALLRAIVNPHSGIRLRGMMTEAGLGDIEQLTHVFEVAHADFARTFFLHDLLASAVTEGEVSAAEAQEFTVALAQREADGTFFANAIGYAVAGTRR